MIPAFLDYIGGTPWLRGFLPMLNRFGHSVPPILFARRLKVMPRKKMGTRGWLGRHGGAVPGSFRHLVLDRRGTEVLAAVGLPDASTLSFS